MSEMTQGEITRAIQRIENAQEGYVSREVYERDLHEITNDVREIRDSQKWMMRLLVTQFFGLIVAIIVFIATQGVP